MPQCGKAPKENLVRVGNDDDGFRELLAWLADKGVVSDGRLLLTASQKKRAEDEMDRLSKTVRDIEDDMREIIESDSEMKKNFHLAMSVKGIGMVCALALICTTHNFTRIPTARKMV